MDISTLGGSVQDTDRPYVVFSNKANNKCAPTINVMPLSKQIGKELPVHVLLTKTEQYGLDAPSIILVEQPLTINKDKITDIIGTLDADDIKRLNQAIKIQAGIMD
jgi:mRNA-degrading endonuclease toxin of MazEF toxin-antitoxin module